MGDDIEFAQKFTSIAADGLGYLTQMDMRATDSTQIANAMLSQIQNGANRLQARHIYKSTQDVLKIINDVPRDIDLLNSRIKSLGLLVTHYARGLGDILGDISPDIIETNTALESAAPQTDDDKWQRARETLKGLIPYTEPSDANALSNLMRRELIQAETTPIRPDTATASSAPLSSPPLSSPPLSSPLLSSEAVASKPAPAANSQSANEIALDTLMRNVIQDALSVARRADRTISLSYDMGEASLAEDLCEDLCQRLGKTLKQIIHQAMPSDRIGHIDINLAGSQLHIMAGTTAVRVPIRTPQIGLDLEVSDVAQPKITADVEQGLRNQLNALLDNSGLDNSGPTSPLPNSPIQSEAS